MVAKVNHVSLFTAICSKAGDQALEVYDFLYHQLFKNQKKLLLGFVTCAVENDDKELYQTIIRRGGVIKM